MNKLILPILAAFIACALPALGKPKKVELPKIFENASSIYVEASPDDRDTPDLTSEDRLAMVAVQNALRDWGRYSLTADRDHADLILVVHRARLESSDPTRARTPVVYGGGQRPPTRSPFPTGNDPSNSDPGGAGSSNDEVAPPEDQLSVYIASGSSTLTHPVWSQSRRNGLNAPQLPLFKQLKEAVEAAYPK